MKPGIRIRTLLGATLSVALLTSTAVAKKKPETPASDGASDQVVATVGGSPITNDQLDRKVREVNPQAFQQWYDARNAVLRQMIDETLLDRAAAKAGKTAETLLQEALSSVAPVTDEDVAGFFEQNKNRMGGRSFEEMGPQIRAYLEGQQSETARNGYLEGLRQAADVAILLDPPRVDVRIAANDPYRGPESAPIQIVEFSDYQ